MALYYPYSGFRNASEYVCGGIAWITSSQLSSGLTQFSFPNVTKSVYVQNVSGSNIGISFAQSSSNGYIINSGSSFSSDLAITTLFVSSSNSYNLVNIFVNLTGIPQRNYPM